LIEKLRQKTQETETTSRRRSFQAGSRPLSYKSSSDNSDNELSGRNIQQILAECQKNLEHNEALRKASPQLLRPEDYVSFETFHSADSQSNLLVKNVRCGNDNEQRLLSRYRKGHADSGVGRGGSDKRRVKGFCHYVTFVTCYVMFIIIVTLLITQIDKI
jgi:hypothetical protein